LLLQNNLSIVSVSAERISIGIVRLALKNHTGAGISLTSTRQNAFPVLQIGHEVVRSTGLVFV